MRIEKLFKVNEGIKFYQHQNEILQKKVVNFYPIALKFILQILYGFQYLIVALKKKKKKMLPSTVPHSLLYIIFIDKILSVSLQ